MLNFIKQPKRLTTYCIYYMTSVRNQRFVTAVTPLIFNFSQEVRLNTSNHNRSLLVGSDQVRLILSRNKSKGRRNKTKYNEEESSDEEDELDDEDDELYSKGDIVKTFTVKSMRVDTVLKTTLGISRKKVDIYFYQNKIRVNGKILQKKSITAKVNDEIDIILGFARDSSNQLSVHRVKILKTEPNPDSDNILIKVCRDKNLTINNYNDGNHWKELEEENL